jgi:hypothetical protein
MQEENLIYLQVWPKPFEFFVVTSVTSPHVAVIPNRSVDLRFGLRRRYRG